MKASMTVGVNADLEEAKDASSVPLVLVVEKNFRRNAVNGLCLHRRSIIINVTHIDNLLAINLLI